MIDSLRITDAMSAVYQIVQSLSSLRRRIRSMAPIVTPSAKPTVTPEPISAPPHTIPRAVRMKILNSLLFIGRPSGFEPPLLVPQTSVLSHYTTASG